MPNATERIQRELAEIKSFQRERFEPMQARLDTLEEENKRMEEGLRSAMDAEKEAKRAQLWTPGNDRFRVRGGRYDGMDALDLALLRSIGNAVLDDSRAEPQSRQHWQGVVERVGEHRRAMDSTTAGSGDELVPTLEASQLWMDVNLMTAVASLFTTIDMPSNPFEIPLQLGDVNWYPGTANTATTGTDPTTAKRTLTAYELVAMISWAYELDEDAVIAMMPTLRSTLVRNAAEVLDDVVLNADTTLTNNINADGATIADTDTDGVAQWLIGFDGLRHIPLVDNTGQGNDHSAALTLTSLADFTEIRGFLGKYGVRPSECAYIVDIPLYIQAMAISDIATLDKYGPQATVLTGEIGRAGGVPVIVSEVMRETDDDGLVTDPVGAAGNDNSGILVVNRTQYYKGFKRELLLETERDIQKRQTVMVASMRVGFEGRNANASDTAVALQYNIT